LFPLATNAARGKNYGKAGGGGICVLNAACSCTREPGRTVPASRPTAVTAFCAPCTGLRLLFRRALPAPQAEPPGVPLYRPRSRPAPSCPTSAQAPTPANLTLAFAARHPPAYAATHPRRLATHGRIPLGALTPLLPEQHSPHWHLTIASSDSTSRPPCAAGVAHRALLAAGGKTCPLPRPLMRACQAVIRAGWPARAARAPLLGSCTPRRSPPPPPPPYPNPIPG